MTAFWQEFAILFAGALLGGAAVIPYSFRLIPKDKPLRFSVPVLFVLSLVQTAIIFAIVTALGLIMAHKIGLGAPYIEAAISSSNIPPFSNLAIAVILGALSGATLLIADFFFLPYWPQALRNAAQTATLLENVLASLYGGIDEELLMRLFGFSLLVWLLSFALQSAGVVFWVSNIVITIIFGLGHLPALKNMLGNITRAIFIRSLLLNFPVGILCGWLFWSYGIEAAMIAHFSADIIYHVIGTIVLRRKIKPSNGILLKFKASRVVQKR